MDSGEYGEYGESDDNVSINESEFDTDGEQEGYAEIENLEEQLDQDSKNIKQKEYLNSEKLKLLLQYNKGFLDNDIYYGSLNKIDKELFEIEILNDNINNTFINKEVEFTELLDTYINRSKQGIKLNQDEIKTIKSLELLINNLREEYSNRSKPLEPEESFVHEFDDEGYLSNWEVFEEKEMKEMVSLAKRYKLKISIPKESNFISKQEYSNAKDKFFKFMIPYLPNYVSKLKITSIGEVTERTENIPLSLRIKDEIEEINKLGIKLSQQDKDDILEFKKLKSKLSDLTSDVLINCIGKTDIISENIGNLPYILQLKLNKRAVLKYKPVQITTTKEPKDEKMLLLNLLSSLGEKNLENKTIPELEKILDLKYEIPPSLYYNKKNKYSTLIIDKNGYQRNLSFNYNANIPLLMIKKTPIPEGTPLTNKNYYETYLPVNDYIYSHSPNKDNIKEIWSVPVMTSDGKYVLKRIETFKEYLQEMRRIIIENIKKNEKSISDENNLIKRETLKQVLDINKDKVFQIDEYLKNKRILPSLKERGVVSKVNIPGVTYITEWQRKVNIKKLLIGITKNVPTLNNTNANQVIENLENIIFSKSQSVEDYLDKIDNMLFIFNAYPTIKTDILLNKINLYQIVIFDKIYSKKFKSSVSTKMRLIILSQIKKVLSSSLQGQFKKSKILEDIILNNESKKIELLLFDLFNDNNTEYLRSSKQIIKLLSLKSFATDIIKGNITNEQLVVLIKNLKLNLVIGDNTNISNLKPVSIKQLTLKEIDALLSQDRLLLKELINDKKKNEALNNNHLFILDWKPPINILSKEEMSRWEKLKSNANQNIKDILLNEYYLVGPKMKYSNIVEANTIQLVEYKNRLMQKYKIDVDNSRNNILKQIYKIENKLLELQNERINKIKLIYKVKRLMIKKYVSPRPTKKETGKKMDYQLVDQDLLFEVIQAYKRNLIINDVVLDLSNKNRLIVLLELYDLNDLNLRLHIINQPVHDKIMTNLLLDINIIKKNFDMGSINRYFVMAINNIANTLSISNNLLEMISEWPKEYIPQNEIVDYYSNDLFLFLLNNRDPMNFYNENLRRVYSSIVIKNSPKEIEEYKSQFVLYNPDTNKIGKEAYNGYLFKVYKVDKNPSTGLPIVINTSTEIENPRLGTYIRVPVSFEKHGKYNFIKVPIVNPNDPLDTFRWKEVPTGAVGMYALNYDSCSRFTNETSCNVGAGLANSKCEYINNKCTADYSNKVGFGKRKRVKIILKKRVFPNSMKYSLKDTTPKRHKILVSRVNFEKKKRNFSLREAAVAVNRRLNVLRIYNKNNQKNTLILTKDMNYIRKKYIH